MINCNPETVSTDYDTSDRLYFEPLTTEDVAEILDVEKSNGVLARRHRAIWRTDAAEACAWARAGGRAYSRARRSIRSTSPKIAIASNGSSTSSD